MEDEITRIVLFVSKDELTGTFETEDEETEAFDKFEADLETICDKHKIEIGSIEFQTG